MLFRLAWRNILRNGRRTFITVVTISFAALLSIAMRGLQLGTYRVNIRNAVEMFSGYLQMQDPEYDEKPSLRNSFELTPEIRSVIEKTGGVTGWAPRIYSEGLLSLGDKTLGAAIFGVDPEAERRTTKIAGRMVEGTFLEDGPAREAVLGVKLLENLEARIGDSIVVLSQAYDGTLGNLFFLVTGTVRTGSPDLDRHGLFMRLEDARDLLSMGERVSVVALAASDLDAVDRIERVLDAALDDREVEALGWKEIMPELEQSIELDNISGILMLAVLVIVAAFGILNTLLMSVTERFNEFGVLLAVGMPPGRLVATVLIETLLIIGLGLAAGNIMAAGVNYWIVANPIEISGSLTEMYEQFGFIPRMESTMDWRVFARSSLAILIVSMIAFLYPGWKVFRLEAMKGIRYT